MIFRPAVDSSSEFTDTSDSSLNLSTSGISNLRLSNSKDQINSNHIVGQDRSMGKRDQCRSSDI